MITISHSPGDRMSFASRRSLLTLLLLLSTVQLSESAPQVSRGPDESSSKLVAAKLIRSMLKSSYTFLPKTGSNSTSRDRQPLFRDYAIVRFRKKDKKLGLRWRTRKDVLSGKGKTICGNEKCFAVEGGCEKGRITQLRNFEVKFGYVEQEQLKCALVKVKLCRHCTKKLRHGSYGT
mmetsp:Transcript_23859/g.38345  ORF Transcript_23859/g.38345 Transcript_23859/m.38345 type:complete len:177 (-) Transcript_23859:314-844(-)